MRGYKLLKIFIAIRKEDLKMKNKDYFFNHVKEELEEAFELYYDLTFGFYKLEKPQELSKVIKNEVYAKGGKFCELFEEIGKVKDEIYTLEDEINTNDETFNINEGLSVQISNLYDDAIREISKLMFMYGVKYGKNLEICLDDISNNFFEGENNGRQ